MKNYYDKSYFSWQKRIGAFGGKANLFKFKDFIKPNNTVIDFGCGGGYLLNNVICKHKIGVEVNEEAIRTAKEYNIDVHKDFKTIKNNIADVIISNNALEHVESPLSTLKELYNKLRKSGLIIFVVPCESADVKYIEKDINQHLYSWSPGELGNLFRRAGFKVKIVEPLYHKWPPYYLKVHQIFGDKIFNLICLLYGKIDQDIVQIRIVAEK
jgi:SAM-dependent methyltransferase